MARKRAEGKALINKFYLKNVDIKYIYDDKGRKKSVIVPIEVWEEIIKKSRIRRNVKKYRGIIKAKEIENEIKKLRDEWERI